MAGKSSFPYRLCKIFGDYYPHRRKKLGDRGSRAICVHTIKGTNIKIVDYPGVESSNDCYASFLFKTVKICTKLITPMRKPEIVKNSKSFNSKIIKHCIFFYNYKF